jgi:hypothetical protein
LLDRDARSLLYANEKLSTFQDLKFRTVGDDAVLPVADLKAILGDRKYDLTYSFGLFDHLTDDHLVQCLKNFTRRPNAAQLRDRRATRFPSLWSFGARSGPTFLPHLPRAFCRGLEL